MPSDPKSAYDKEWEAIIREAVAAELRSVVARLKLKQGEAAARSGMHRVTLNRLLNGERSVSSEQLVALGLGLDFDPGELLNAAKRKCLEQFARLDAED